MSEYVRLVLVFPPRLETALTGALVAEAGLPGFTLLHGEGHSSDFSNASPRSSVKGAHVIPNRERRKCSVVLSGNENGSGVGLVLDGANASISEQLACENASTSAREKV